MLSINTNLSSLIAQNSLTTSTNKLNQAIERMTTGFKINHAKDNAANYSIATNLTTKIGAYMVAEDNCAMGLDMLATANGSLDQISDKLSRLRILAEQASNGTYGEQSLKAINAEANALVDEVERIYNNTEYNGINLMKGRVTGTEESKFIKDIDRRDTSKMTKLSSIDPTEKLELGTYSISTAEELAQLATMTNNGLIGANTEFVLAADIDLSGYQSGEGWVPIGFEETEDSPGFRALFDGNGFTITGLKIDTTKSIVSLFGSIIGATVKNLAVENANVKGGDHVSGIVASVLDGSVVDNCYITGDISGVMGVGGVWGYARDSAIKNCHSSVNVIAETKSGVLGGQCNIKLRVSIIDNCYSNGQIDASSDYNGGLVGATYNSKIKNSYSLSNVKGGDGTGSFVGLSIGSTIENCYSQGDLIANSTEGFVGILINTNTLVDTNKLTSSDNKPFVIDNKKVIINRNTSLNLQIGTNSDSSSQISVDTGYVIDGITSLRGIGLNDVDYLTYIDRFMSNLSGKMTTLGASENRLESALDEISTQYENLVSTRSTIRDADIAEVSSEYIRQQILQQASATLMSTANQSPSIALQLI